MGIVKRKHIYALLIGFIFLLSAALIISAENSKVALLGDSSVPYGLSGNDASVPYGLSGGVSPFATATGYLKKRDYKYSLTNSSPVQTITLYEKGKLADSDSQLLVDLSSATGITKGVMIKPDGSTVTKVPVSGFMTVLGQSGTPSEFPDIMDSTVEGTEKPDSNPLGLGASSAHDTSLFAIVPYTNTINYDLAFDITEAGYYTIDFFAGDSAILPDRRVVYYVSDVYAEVNTAQPLSISVGSNHVKPSLAQTMDITYVPQKIGGKETVTIELPLGFALNTYPANSPGVQISTKDAQPFSPKYYDDKYGQMFLDANNTLPALQRLTSQHVIIKYDESKLVSGDQGTSFQITLKPHASTNYFLHTMSKVMFAAKAVDTDSYDKLPYRFVAYANDDATGALLAEDSAAETSIVTGYYGMPVEPSRIERISPDDRKLTRIVSFQYSSHPYFVIDYPTASNNLSWNILQFSNPNGSKYPISDIYYYTPLPDPAKFSVKDNIAYTIENIDGKDYRKILLSELLYDGSYISTLYDKTSYQSVESRNQIIPSQLGSIEFGDTYFSYNSAETGESGYIQAYNVPDLNTPADTTDPKLYGMLNINMSPTGNFKQGTSLGLISGSLDFKNTQLTLAYLDPTITITSPYEVAPQSINIKSHYSNQIFGEMYLDYYVVTKDNLDDVGIKHTLGPYSNDYILTAPDIPFNVTEDEHVKTIVIRADYIDTMYSQNFVYFNLAANTRTHDKDGIRLPVTKVVPTSAEFKYSNAVRYFGRPEAERVLIDPDPAATPVVINRNISVWRETLVDALAFGGIAQGPMNGAAFNNVYQTYNPSLIQSTTGFTFVNKAGATSYLKDYENVKVRMFPENDVGQDLWSLIDQMSIFNTIEGIHVDKIDISYKTNLSPIIPKTSTRRTQESATIMNVFFDLEPDEYITEVEIDYGTIYGEAWGNGANWHARDNSSGGYGRIVFSQSHISFYYKTSSYFYPGIEGKEKKITPSNSSTAYIDSQVTVGDTAKHINQSDYTGGYLANKGRSVVNFSLYRDATITTRNSDVYPAKSEVYQGETLDVTFGLELENNNLINATIKKLPRRVYIELAPFVDIVNFPGHALEKIKPLSNGNNLYVYYSDLPLTLDTKVKAQVYVRPDAPLSDVAIPFVINCTVSYDELIEDYMSGDYYLEYPFYKYTFKSETSPPPAIWGETMTTYYSTGLWSSGKFNKILYFTNTGLEGENMKNGSASTGVNGHIFKDHEKDDLGIQVTIFNSTETAGEIEKHETHIALPRTDRNTNSFDSEKLPISVENDFNLYLTGDLLGGSTGKAFDVRYEDKNGDPVVPATPADYASITDIFVITHNILRENVSFRFPLATDYAKADTEDYSAYVGLAGRSIVSGNEPLVPTIALQYLFGSYQLDIRLGYDNSEIGSSQYSLPYVNSQYPLKAEIFDKNDQLIATVSKLNNIVPVNDDVSYIKLTYDKNIFMLTKPHLIGSYVDTNTNSDFERDNDDRLDVNLDALKYDVTNRHDVGLLAIPKITFTPTTITTAVTGSAYTTVNLINSATNSSIPSSIQNDYLYTILNVGDTGIATAISNSPTRRFTATGVKKGDTYLTFKITNRLNDEFLYQNIDGTPKELPIKVTPLYFNGTSITTTFESNSGIVETGDKFAAKYWGVGDSATPKSIMGIPPSPSGVTMNSLERGAVNYIMPDIPTSYKGYEFVKFKVLVDGATSSLPLTLEADGSYSFTLPINPTSVRIEMELRNKAISATIKKVSDISSVMISPTDKFRITVTEVGGSAAPLVDKDFAWNESASVSLTYGKTYLIEETLSTTPVYMKNYYLNSVKVVDSSNILVPNQTVNTVGTNKYNVVVRNSYSDGNVIVAQNTYKTGPGISSSKVTQLFNIADEDFKFELKGNNTFTAFGKVTREGTSASNIIKWYTDETYTNLKEVAVLPFGDYTIEEVALGANSSFEFDKIKVDSVAISGSIYSFTVSDTTTVAKSIEFHNKIRVIGGVTVNKTLTTSVITSDQFEFTLKNTATGETFTSTANVTASSSSSLVFNEWKKGGVAYTLLPLGEYTLTENLAPAGNYVWDGFDTANIGANTGASLTLAPDGKTATFKLSASLSGATSVTVGGKNTLKTGSITINKYLQGSKAELPQDFKFDLYRVNADNSTAQINQSGTPSTAPVVVSYLSSTTDPLSVTLPNLPYGKYFIREHLNDYFLLMNSSNATEVGSVDPDKFLRYKVKLRL